MIIDPRRLKPPWPVDTFAIASGLLILAVALIFGMLGKDGYAMFYTALGLINLSVGSWGRHKRESRQ